MDKELYSEKKKEYYNSAVNENYNEIFSTIKENNKSEAEIRAISNILKRFITDIDKNQLENYKTDIVQYIIETDNDYARSVMVEILVYYYDYRSIFDTIINRIENLNTNKFRSDDFLLHLKNSKHEGNRILCSYLLGYYDKTEYTSHILDLCSDTNPKVQLNSIRVCSKIDNEKCNQLVISKTYSSVGDIRITAIKQLKHVNTNDSVYRCIDIIKSTDDYNIKSIVIENLGHIGSEISLGVLIYNMETDDDDIRRLCLKSMLRLINTASKSSGHMVRRSIVSLLHNTEQEYIKHDLVNIISETDTHIIKRNAVWLFCQIVDESNDSEVKKLIQYLSDDDKRVRQIVTSKLVDIGNKKIIEYLESYIKNNDLPKPALEKSDFIRDQIKDKSSYEEKIKDTVQYTKVDEPSDYTEKHKK